MFADLKNQFREIGNLSQNQILLIMIVTGFVAMLAVAKLGQDLFGSRHRKYRPKQPSVISNSKRYFKPKESFPYRSNVYEFTNEKRTAISEKRLAHTNDIVSRKIMNQSERNFFLALTEILPNHLIFSQVSFNALVTHGTWTEKTYFKLVVRRKFNTKYVDFVICTKPDFEVFAVVEFDGQGHDSVDDAQRDGMLRTTGYRVERFTHLDSFENIKTKLTT